MIFDGADLRSFSNDFARKVLIFGVDNFSSSHTDNFENNIFVLSDTCTV